MKTAERHFEEINRHTMPGTGITRPSYSSPETQAMKYVASWATDLGLLVLWDIAGNLHCIREGNLPEIAFGSHLDSVPSGGRYDGVAGVVAGMMVLERILSEPTEHWSQLRLIVYRGEESAWFGKCYLGSLALFGKLPPEALKLRRRAIGVTLEVAIHEAGGSPLSVQAGMTVLDPKTIARFFEVHIEQGPVLVNLSEQSLNAPIGIVTSIAGNHRFLNAIVSGRAGHSGTTPMKLRDDAVVKFCKFYQEVFNARAVINGSVVVTIGKVSTDPDKHAVSVIPDEVRFTLEYRSGSPEALTRFEEMVRKRAEHRDIVLGPCLKTDPVDLDSALIRDVLMPAVRKTESDVHLLVSGAGHDAAVFQEQGIPTGMIFIRNQFGSHNPNEAMEMADFEVACEALYLAVTTSLPENV